jgi:hypothetical protein
MADASPSRNAKRNVPSTSLSDNAFETTGAFIPQNTRKPLQRQQGSVNMNTRDPIVLYFEGQTAHRRSRVESQTPFSFENQIGGTRIPFRWSASLPKPTLYPSFRFKR